MARKKNRKQIIPDVTLTHIAAEGKAFCRLPEGKVLFVEDAVPGDVADVLVLKNKKDYANGRVATLQKAASQRIAPFCAHFDDCGGCKWQYLNYAQQLAYKSQIVEDSFRRIAKINEGKVLPILGAEPNRYYRNKLEFTFSTHRWITKAEAQTDAPVSDAPALGFHAPQSFYKIVQIDHCFLQAEPANAIRNFIYAYAIAHDIPFYDPRAHTGCLRNLIVRSSTTGGLMLIVSMGSAHPLREKLLDAVLAEFPAISSLHYVINEKKNDTLYDQDIILYAGNAYITESLDGYVFKISPKSFFQTNSYQALALYRKVLEFAALEAQHTVYDLYTGTGSIAIFLAKHCRKVVGIELVPDAIADAKENALLNDTHNCDFLVGDVKNTLNADLIATYGKADVLVLDPPRAGLHGDVVEQILAFAPQRIVYVSCNPVTQARDIALLHSRYELLQYQAVDMFPHTYHIENVAVLVLRE
ncbi:MAG: 23S rRNA (uracil(1939)-C(5))-methyltransferase RlmD [Chitinophagales bacterium]|nr:23S rRNA (uracil(1939)-C(5))-methyltransferase RlmD [Bacteroidota bacterium]MCB9042466.1 23S rRNA (uracil(1939)-C(5))-methyltransferase RlmD [Chitinophagales bacterium]